MRDVAEDATHRDEEAEDASAHRVRHGLHQRGFDHRVAAHEEETIDRERHRQAAAWQVREGRDDERRRDHHAGGPTRAVAVAEVAEERVADDAHEEDDAQGRARFLHGEAVGLLQEERAEAAHAVPGEVAQCERDRGGEEEEPEGGSGEERVRRRRLCWRLQVAGT